MSMRVVAGRAAVCLHPPENVPSQWGACRIGACMQGVPMTDVRLRAEDSWNGFKIQFIEIGTGTPSLMSASPLASRPMGCLC